MNFTTAGKRFHSSVTLIPWVVMAAFCFVPAVCADPAQEYWKKAEELYESHHLAPDRFQRALEWYEKAGALRPNDYELLWELSKRYQIYGQTLGQDEKKRKRDAWERGLELGRRAVEVNPAGKEGHFYYMANMGALAQSKGMFTSLWRFRKIKKEMDRTLELAPDWPPILVARAQFLMEMPGVFGGDKEEAMRLCQRAVELDPDHLPTYVCLARLLADEHRYDEAIDSLNRVLLCKEPRQYANWLKVDRPRAEAVRKEIMQETSRTP